MASNAMQGGVQLYETGGCWVLSDPCARGIWKTLTQISAPQLHFGHVLICVISLSPPPVSPASGGRPWYTAIAAQFDGSHATAR